MQDIEPIAFDLTDPANFRQGHPFVVYDRIRDAQPVYRNPNDDRSHPVWLLTRHKDIEAVARDNLNFTSAQGFRIQERDGGIALLKPHVRDAVASTLLTMDPPRHGEVRRPMQSHFMPSVLRRLEVQIDGFVGAMVAALPADSEIEFVTTVASEVPIRTLCLVLGIPDVDRPRVFDWTNRLVGTSDPEYGAGPEQSNAVFEEVFDYGARLLEIRRNDPGDDLLSTVVQIFADGSPKAQTMLNGMFTLLLAAGNETTRNSLTGSIVALSRFPDQRRKLTENPGLIEQAVPELLRYVTPVIQMMRVATADVTVGGQKIEAGDRLAFLYGAANRDPDVFTDPHRLDINRENAARHLSFGLGIHHCLGARIATMQLNSLLRALFSRFPNLEASGEPDYLQSNFVCGIKRLVVSTGSVRDI